MNAKTRARIDRIIQRVDPYLRTGHIAALREIVEHELREQDRDTRHACAEAVASMSNPYLRNDAGYKDHQTFELAKTTAHQRCLNVQAI